jgi:hypothetical protein
MPSGERSKNSHSPVALLQWSCSSKSKAGGHGENNTFVIDLQELCQQGIRDPTGTPLTEVEAALKDASTQLFNSNHTSIAGFGIHVNFDRLAASYPHLTCFQTYYNVLDLPNVIAHHVFNLPAQQQHAQRISNDNNTMSSLLQTVAKLLG